MKRNFLTGLAILLPIALTLWILSLLLNILTHPLERPPKWQRHFRYRFWHPFPGKRPNKLSQPEIKLFNSK